MSSHNSLFIKFIGGLLWLALCLGNVPARAACDTSVPCDKCAKESEFSWNPGNQYVTSRLAHFYELDDAVKAAYDRADDVELTARAKEYLDLADIYRCNWNYGNAIHDANRYLGLASLRHGNADEAARYLVLAGKSTGSPQLDSFGPDLDLADQLLRLGKTQAVTEYLSDIKHFWSMDDGQVDQWLTAIRQGEKPSLDRYASMKPKVWMIVLNWLVMSLPAIVVLSLAYVGRKTMRRKVLFLIVAAISGYASLVASYWGTTFLATHDLGGLNDSMFLTVYLPLILALLVPTLVVYGEYRFFHRRLDSMPSD